jgi:predicted enzyme related to lactoylglutathione lyase
MPPTLGHGKICYVEIPSVDVERSAVFYQRVFGWRIRRRGDGATAFDDGVGEVSGAFVSGRAPLREPGLQLYIMVDDAEAAVRAVAAQGGEIVQPIGADAPEITARFRDPAGNVLGIYQEPTLARPNGRGRRASGSRKTSGQKPPRTGSRSPLPRRRGRGPG